MKKYSLAAFFIAIFILCSTEIFSQNVTWTERTTSGVRLWFSIASSSDGIRLAAVPLFDYVYTSTDGGASWTARTSTGIQHWYSIASSSDGMRLAATTSFGYIFTSSDGGANWTQQTSAGINDRPSITSSADGMKLATTQSGGYIATSTDGGTNWIERPSAGSRYWCPIASSSDGSKLAAATGADVGYVYTSTDGGVNWTERTSSGLHAHWYSMASSSDGMKLAAVILNGPIFTSTDGGASWSERTSAGIRTWISIASSSDGTRLAATVEYGYIYTSTDGGINWTEQSSIGSKNWLGITSSSDGMKFTAVVYDGYIYSINTCQSISTGSIPGTVCRESTLVVSYSTCTSINADNVFTAQLSDASGNFSTPVDIGSVSGTASGTISATIPSATPDGTNYLIRVVSSSPAYTGTSNGTPLSINCTFNPDITTGLVGYWSFDDGDASDNSGNGRDGTLINNPQIVPGKIGCAMEFNGVDQYVLFNPNQNTSDLYSSSGYTWALWFKGFDNPTGTNYATAAGQAKVLFGCDDGWPWEDLVMGFGWGRTPVNTIQFNSDGPGAYGGRMPDDCKYYISGGYQNGTWYHIAGTHDYSNNVVKLYVNGTLVNSVTFASSPITRNMPCGIGSSPWISDRNYFNGVVDDVRAYNRSLSESDILALYQYSNSSSVCSSISTGSVPGMVCRESILSVSYSTNSNFNSNNIFTAQLSDATGSFSTPVDIGTVSRTTSGTIAVTIPSSTPEGTNYRIRVVSSSPATAGSDNGSPISISIGPTAVITPSGQTFICQGLGITLQANTGSGLSYQWKLDGQNISGATNSSYYATAAGSYTGLVTNANNCSQLSNATSVTVIPVTVCSITISPSPVVAGQTPNTIFRGYGSQSVTLTATAANSYVWSSNPAGFSSTSRTPSVSPAQTTLYAVTITNQYGCTSSASVTITVEDVRCGNNNDKVILCHYGNTLCVSQNAVVAHLTNHGDMLGTCPSPKEKDQDLSLPKEFVLHQNYPNPFNPTTTISYAVPDDALITLKVYDVLGREMTTLVNEQKAAGYYSVQFDGSGYSCGVYTYVLSAPGIRLSQSMQIMK